jgi:hypothetical protein
LRSIGISQGIAEGDVWMREKNHLYEYIAVYVDDLAIAAIDPGEIITTLKEQHKLNFKGVGPISFHLGCDFQRDEDGTLSFGPKKYIDKMLSNYEAMFGHKPKEYSTPLEKNDHPELDTSDLLTGDDISKYQSMIGASQWAISLGRFDIQTAVMTMSQFRISPRIGHLKRLQHIYGYLKCFKNGAILFGAKKPVLSTFSEIDHDWKYSVYGNVKELIPENVPISLATQSYVRIILMPTYIMIW